MEMLVVLLIIGIMVGLARLSLSPAPRAALMHEQERISLWLGAVADEVQVRSLPLAVSYSDQHFRLWQQQQQQWVPYTGDAVAAELRLPADMQLSQLELEGQSLSSGQRWVLWPGAALPLLRWTLTQQQQQLRMVSNALGQWQEQAGQP